MTTTSHAFFTLAFAPAGMDVVQAVIGSVLPDLPFWFGPLWYALTRTGWNAGALEATKDGLITGPLLRAGHSFVVWAAVTVMTWFAAPWLMPLMWGWLGHNVSDILTHHGEAHAHFWPASDWRFRSPVSYYEWEHHALGFILVEYSLAALIVASWLRHERLSATAWALVSTPLWLMAVAVLAGGALALRLRGRGQAAMPAAEQVPVER